MRRVLAIGAGLAALGLAIGTASAQQAPTARFSAPRTAPAGSPVWVRSVDPCPVIAGAYQYVIAGFAPQIKPAGEPAGIVSDSSTADLRPGGHWELTITAPDDFPEGTTKSYSIHASCVVVPEPYATDSTTTTAPTTTTAAPTTTTTDPGATTTTAAPTTTTTAAPAEVAVSVMRYQLRPLIVTSALGSSAAAPEGDVTTTTAGPATTTTQPMVTAQGGPTTFTPDGFTSAVRTDDERARSAEARDELARLRQGGGEVSLSASAVSSSAAPTGSVDGGLPWWSFVAATMLAVGAVIGWGVKRSSAIQ